MLAIYFFKSSIERNSHFKQPELRGATDLSYDLTGLLIGGNDSINQSVQCTETDDNF